MINEIRKRLEGATPGPWEQANKSVRCIGTQQEYTWGKAAPSGYAGGICNCLGAGYGATKGNKIDAQAQANADFIAHAPTDIAYLLERVEKLEKERDALTPCDVCADSDKSRDDYPCYACMAMGRREDFIGRGVKEDG